MYKFLSPNIDKEILGVLIFSGRNRIKFLLDPDSVFLIGWIRLLSALLPLNHGTIYNFGFSTAVDLNKDLKQIKLITTLNICTPISE